VGSVWSWVVVDEAGEASGDGVVEGVLQVLWLCLGDGDALSWI
jgi:hypothetical protein